MTADQKDILSSGVSGLDSILHGGFPANHPYLVKGSPGTGKTTLALQFLVEGVRNGECTVYVSFSESMSELSEVADSHGWPLDKIEVLELAADISQRALSGSSMFHSADVDLPKAIDRIYEVIEQVQPTRLAVDSLTELHNMAESHRHFRRALFQLKVSLEHAGVTTIFVGEERGKAKTEAESLVHGVLQMEMDTPIYGPTRRRMEVMKLRGRTYETGFHDFEIVRGGLRVFPRIRPKASQRRIGDGDPVKSGVDALDMLVGGGLDRGTTSLFVGPSGTGKSSVVMQYAIAAAEREEKAVVYAFDEDAATIERRATTMELPLAKYIESGCIRIQSIDAAEMSPGQFAHLVRQDVRDQDLAFVAIDSINGYVHAMPNDRALIPHLHDLLTYLGSQGIIMMLVMTLSGLFRSRQDHVANLSYLADTVLLLRYFEREGEIFKSITAAKRRTGDHEKLIRELIIGRGGVRVGEPIGDVSNVLGATPSVDEQGSESILESEAPGARNQTYDE